MKKLLTLAVLLAVAALWSADLLADRGPDNHTPYNTVLSNGRPYFYKNRWWSMFDSVAVNSQGTYSNGTHYDRRPFICPPADGTIYYDAILRLITYEITPHSNTANKQISSTSHDIDSGTDTQNNVASNSTEYDNSGKNHTTTTTGSRQISQTVHSSRHNTTHSGTTPTDTTTYNRSGKTYTKSITTQWWEREDTVIAEHITTSWNDTKTQTTENSNSYLNLYSWIHPAAYAASHITPPASHTNTQHYTEDVGEWEYNGNPLGRDMLIEDNEWHTYSHVAMIDSFAERLSLKQVEGTSWNVSTRNLRMAMKPHIRLYDQTKFGSHNMTEYIPKATMVNDTGSVTVYIHSFLTDTVPASDTYIPDGTIRIEKLDGDTAYFRIHDVTNGTQFYDMQVGANRCGRYDRTPSDVDSLLALNDDQYSIPFYFCPTNHDQNVRTARFKVSNAGNSAIIEVQGNVDFEPLRLTVISPAYDMTYRHSSVNTASYQADMKQDLIDHDGLKCNYDDAVITFENGVPTDVARISSTGKIDFYHKAQFSFDIVATSAKAAQTQGNISTARLHITLMNVPYGTMHFLGTQNDVYANKANWERHDWLPTLSQDVSIEAPCRILNGSLVDKDTIEDAMSNDTRRCHDFTITGNGSLTITSQGEFDVQGTATNADASRFVLETAADSRATFRHMDGNPAATVNAYLKGYIREEGNVNGMDWQYRGSIGLSDQMNLTDIRAYRWDEQYNASNCWRDLQRNTVNLAPWVGYAIDNHTNGPRTVTYTSHLLPIRAGHTYNLTFTETGRPNEGVNLVTNSFAAPVRPRQLIFENCKMEVYFYNTSTHDQYVNDSASQIVTIPVNTAQAAGLEDLIDAGQSFAVQALSAGATVTIPEHAVASHWSGAMNAPAREYDFNVLGIRASINGHLADRVVLIENEYCTDDYDDGFDGTKRLSSQNVTALYAAPRFGRTSVNASESMLGTNVGFHAGSEETEYTLSFETDNLEGYDRLYLVDNLNGNIIDILAGDTYHFHGTTGLDDRRFTVQGSRIIADVDNAYGDDDAVNAIRVADNRAYITGLEGETLRIIDAQGRVLLTRTAHDGMELDLEDLATGAYVITAGGQTVKFIR